MSSKGLIKRVVVLMSIVLPLIATYARAEGPGWTANSTIVRLVTTSDGGVNIMLSPGLNNCISNGGYGPTFASLHPSHPGLRSIQATLLTAYASGQPVSIYFSNANCLVSEVVLGGW